MHFRQWDERWAPSTFFRFCACSLNRSLRHRPVCPMYDLPQDSGMSYTTPCTHFTKGEACFFEHPSFLQPTFVVRGHSCASLLGAEKTSGTPCLLATFFRLCETLCTYGTTSGFFPGAPTSAVFHLALPFSFRSRASATATKTGPGKPADNSLSNCFTKAASTTCEHDFRKADSRQDIAMFLLTSFEWAES